MLGSSQKQNTIATIIISTSYIVFEQLKLFHAIKSVAAAFPTCLPLPFLPVIIILCSVCFCVCIMCGTSEILQLNDR